MQCPGRLCAALAAGSGASGRCLVSCPPRFPLPALCVLRCVWRPARSGCPLPSLAGTPFHAVCAFRGLGPVALLVFPACPLCVCALALPRRPRPPPPPLVGVARAPRAVPVLDAGRAFDAVRAPPRVLPRSCVPFGFFFGGGRPGPVSPLPGLVLCAPREVRQRVWGIPAPGVGVGGGAACAPFPRLCGRGGQWGGGSPCLGPSLCLPWVGNKAGVLAVALAMEGVAPIPLWFVLACCLRARSVWRPEVFWAGSLVLRGSCGSRRQGRGGRPCSVLPPGRRGPAVGRGDHLLCLGGGGGRRPRGLRIRGGAGGTGGGGSRRGSPPPSLAGAACGPLPSPPFVAGASPPGVRVRSGSWGSPGCQVRPAADAPAWRGDGGGRGGP